MRNLRIKTLRTKKRVIKTKKTMKTLKTTQIMQTLPKTLPILKTFSEKILSFLFPYEPPLRNSYFLQHTWLEKQLSPCHLRDVLWHAPKIESVGTKSIGK